MRNSTRLFTCVGLAVGLAAPAWADDHKPTAKMEKKDHTKATSNAAEDVKTMGKMAQGSMMEIEASKVAAAATRKETRDFAELMIRDHTKASEELRTLAVAKNIQLPTMLTKDSKEDIDDLAKEKGIDLDREFISMMIDDHEDAVELFEKASRDAKDMDLQAFAAKTLPTLRSHHRMAQELKAKLDSLSMR